MSEPIIYVDHSEIIDGKLKDLEIAIDDLVEVFRLMEPRLIAYSVYFNEDKNRMTILHIHPDINSLELHLKTFAPRSAATLGSGKVRIHKLQNGFNRLPGLNLSKHVKF